MSENRDKCKKQRSYPGYFYFEDLMCWCMGVRACQTIHKYPPIVDCDVWYCGTTEQWRSTIDEGYNCIEVEIANSPTEALESLLLKLVEA